MAAKLAEAAAASLDWAKDNGVAFDHGKTEAALPEEADCPYSHHPGRHERHSLQYPSDTLAGHTLDSQLTLKEHHAIRLKEGKKALGRLRRLMGQMGLVPVNCRKVMTACIQSVAMFGSELYMVEGRQSEKHHRESRGASDSG
jgi:hypothetical protein